MIEFQQKVTDRNLLILDWYQQVFPNVAKLVSRNGGSLEDAKDVFQEAIVLFYEKQQDRNGTGPGNEYLYGISRYLWYKRYRESASTSSLDARFGEMTEDEIACPATKKLLNFLERSGKKCMEILQSFYYEKLTAKELAIKYGYSTERSATVQKYKCLEKVRNEVSNQNLSYGDFFE